MDDNQVARKAFHHRGTGAQRFYPIRISERDVVKRMVPKCLDVSVYNLVGVR